MRFLLLAPIQAAEDATLQRIKKGVDSKSTPLFVGYVARAASGLTPVLAPVGAPP